VLLCAPMDSSDVPSGYLLPFFNLFGAYGNFLSCHTYVETQKLLLLCRRVRQLSITDLQVALAQQRSNVSLTDNSLAVVVAPHGVSGRLSGCCLNDLVTQLHQSKQQTFSASSLPFRVVASSSANGSTTSGQACYAEVWLGQSSPGGSLGLARQSPTGDLWGNQTRRSYNQREVGQALIYPLDAVLVLMRPPVPSHTYLQRFAIHLLSLVFTK
jgi:hypothetical protein